MEHPLDETMWSRSYEKNGSHVNIRIKNFDQSSYPGPNDNEHMGASREEGDMGSGYELP